MKVGMTFHLMSWFNETGHGNFFIPNTIFIGYDGVEVSNEKR